MSTQAIAWAMQQRTGSSTGKVLLMCLANYADENGSCWPSQSTLAKEAELSERAIRKWLKQLEASGFIERRHRHRPDGSRTSDLIRLRIENQQPDDGKSQVAPSAARLSLAESGAEPTGISRQNDRHEMPGNEPIIEPPIEPTKRAGAREGSWLFSEFWNSWPSGSRPANLKYVKGLFLSLSPVEQLLAVKNASAYRARKAVGCTTALMVPYLTDKLFAVANYNAGKGCNTQPKSNEARLNIPQVFISFDDKEKLHLWEQWFAENTFPSLAKLHLQSPRGNKTGYVLPSYWPPVKGSTNEAMWVKYFRKKAALAGETV